MRVWLFVSGSGGNEKRLNDADKGTLKVQHENAIMTDKAVESSVMRGGNYRWYERGADLAAPVRRDDVSQRMLDDEAVLFEPINNVTIRLNETALHVWNGCVAGATIRGIAKSFCEKYDVTIDRAQDDVEQVLAVFACHGLLEPGTDDVIGDGE